MKKIKIAHSEIGTLDFIYIIAEIGGNFTDFPTAKKLIDLAKSSGANAVKLQHFTAETLTSKKAMFDMENTGKVSQYELFKKYELSEVLSREIFRYCVEAEVDIFSTPAHSTDVDFLETLNVCAHKIGSDDAVNIPLLKYVAKTNKPIILSSGMCTISEVQRSVDAILEEGNDQILLLHCTTNYPAHPESINLKAMATMQNQFPNIPVGYSDHTIGIDACYTAAVMGAKILEYHFTYDKNAEGPDHMLSKDPQEATELIKKVRLLPTMMGDGIKRPMPSEMNTRYNNRKSLILTQNIRKGEKISSKNVSIKRPGYGIACEHYYSVLGKTASRDLTSENVLMWEDIV
jgi:N,N'-diacetyllegionaminate synthase